MRGQFIFCNMCGRSEKIDKFNQTKTYFHSFSDTVGYGSPHDGEKIEFHLCDECLEELNKKMKFSLFGGDPD